MRGCASRLVRDTLLLMIESDLSDKVEAETKEKKSLRKEARGEQRESAVGRLGDLFR